MIFIVGIGAATILIACIARILYLSTKLRESEEYLIKNQKNLDDLENKLMQTRRQLQSAETKYEHSLENIKNLSIQSNRQPKLNIQDSIAFYFRSKLQNFWASFEMLQDTSLSPSQHRLMDILRTEAGDLTSFIQATKDHEDLRNDAFVMNDKPYSISQMVQNVLRPLSLLAAEKRGVLTYTIDPSLPLALRGDSVRLENFLKTWIKFIFEKSSKGTSISLNLITSHNDPMNCEMDMQIAVNGRDDLRELHQHLNNVINDPVSIQNIEVKTPMDILNSMGAEMSVNLEHPKKMVVSLKIQQHKIEAKDLNLVPVASDRKKIAIVSSDGSESEYMETLMGYLGVQIFRARNLDMLQKINKDPLHVLIIDYDMGQHRLLQTAMDNFTKSCPVGSKIIVSSRPLKKLMEVGVLPSQFDAVIPKPIERFYFLNKMQTLLQKDIKPLASDKKAISSTILLAEDDATNRLLIQSILQKMGYQVVVAENGKMALDILKTAPIDIILMDVLMPVMDGLTASREIRKTMKDIPILALTAQSSPADEKRCLESGMNDFISKPMRGEDLSQKLTQWMKKPISAQQQVA